MKDQMMKLNKAMNNCKQLGIAAKRISIPEEQWETGVGLNSCIFCNFHFCCAIACAHWRLRRLSFGSWQFLAWSQGLHSLGAMRPMVMARLVRPNESNRDFVAQSL
jgi:hypothetical protein